MALKLPHACRLMITHQQSPSADTQQLHVGASVQLCLSPTAVRAAAFIKMRHQIRFKIWSDKTCGASCYLCSHLLHFMLRWCYLTMSWFSSLITSLKSRKKHWDNRSSLWMPSSNNQIWDSEWGLTVSIPLFRSLFHCYLFNKNNKIKNIMWVFQCSAIFNSL